MLCFLHAFLFGQSVTLYGTIQNRREEYDEKMDWITDNVYAPFVVRL